MRMSLLAAAALMLGGLPAQAGTLTVTLSSTGAVPQSASIEISDYDVSRILAAHRALYVAQQPTVRAKPWATPTTPPVPAAAAPPPTDAQVLEKMAADAVAGVTARAMQYERDQAIANIPRIAPIQPTK